MKNDGVTEMDKNLGEGREDRLLVFQLLIDDGARECLDIFFSFRNATSSMPFCLSSRQRGLNKI